MRQAILTLSLVQASAAAKKPEPPRSKAEAPPALAARPRRLWLRPETRPAP